MKALGRILCIAASLVALSASPAVASETEPVTGPVCEGVPADVAAQLPRYGWKLICP